MNRENEKAMFAGKKKSGLTKEQVGIDRKKQRTYYNSTMTQTHTMEMALKMIEQKKVYQKLSMNFRYGKVKRAEFAVKAEECNIQANLWLEMTLK